jgi:hypothetical protein
VDHAEQIVEVRKRIAERADQQALLTDTQTQSIEQNVRLLNLLLLLLPFAADADADAADDACACLCWGGARSAGRSLVGFRCVGLGGSCC